MNTVFDTIFATLGVLLIMLVSGLIMILGALLWTIFQMIRKGL